MDDMADLQHGDAADCHKDNCNADSFFKHRQFHTWKIYTPAIGKQSICSLWGVEE